MEIVGKLHKNRNDRWEIVGDDGSVIELSSGSVFEVQIAGRWIMTRLEFCYGECGSSPLGEPWPQAACGWHADHDGHYYAVEPGILLGEGLPARVTDRRL
jgi:Domain of unknown function (DUF5348)